MSTSVRTMFVAVVLAFTAAAGCGKPSPAAEDQADPGGTAVAPPIADASAKAKEIFSQRCTPCHGPSGFGDGPASASLTPHPRNFHDKDWQKGVTDEHIQTIIKVGGAAVGKSPAMPSNPDLVNDPATVAALKDVIRGFGS